jgi:heme/copper-type cytochrome/quinol oxidase subunit 2
MLTIMVFVLVWALAIYTFLDCIRTPQEQMRFLPKIAWLLVIVFVGTVLGPLLWLVFGKRRRPVEQDEQEEAEAEGWVPPDDNPEFLKSLNRDDS